MIRVSAVLLAVACSSSPADREPQTLSQAWARDEVEAFSRARTEHKGVLLHFYASWSVPSETLDHQLRTLAPSFAANFVPLTIDISEPTAATEEILQRYAATTMPAMVLVDTDGTVLERVNGVPDDDALRSVIARAARRLRTP